MDIKELISECTAYDFKVALEEAKPKSWLKSVSAFANGEGDSLFFGVDNDHRVVGLDDVQHVTKAVSRMMSRMTGMMTLFVKLLFRIMFPFVAFSRQLTADSWHPRELRRRQEGKYPRKPE